MAPTNVVASPLTSRPGSACSNDRWSIASPTPFNIPTHAPNPPPAYVSAAMASQIVADHHLSENPDYEQAGPDEDGDERDAQDTARFSDEALGLLNNFLDQTLLSVLATAKSGKLKRLRPAITEVLKPRLAREAIASADEELRELLDGEEEGDEDDVRPASVAGTDVAEGVGDLRTNGNANGDTAGGGFNLTLTWKRTRLRIMVYTRLGDLEDEDEDRFLDDDDDFHHAKRREAEMALLRGDDETADFTDLGLVSPAAAIFLTSVVEYLAEQTILVAGQAASTRTKKTAKPVNGTAASVTKGDAIEPKMTVLDLDMEKVALNPTLGRLWRTWRKRSRNTSSGLSPASPGRLRQFGSLGSFGAPRSVTGESSAWSEAGGGSGSRRASVGVADAEGVKHDEVPDVPEYSELEMASNIALPLPEGGEARDAEEIEIPGLAHEIVDEPEPSLEGEDVPRRRASLSQKPEQKTLLSERPRLTRLRSSSVPPPPASRSWLEYLLGQSKQSQEPVPDVPEKAEADETDEDKVEEEKPGQTGLIAGAAAAVGAVISAAVGGAETIAPSSQDQKAQEETTEAPASVASAPRTPTESVATSTRPTTPRRLNEQEKALKAAVSHVKRLSQMTLVDEGDQHRSRERVMPGHFRMSSDDDSVKASREAAGEHDPAAQQRHLSAMPAPLNVSKGAEGEAPPSLTQPDSAVGESPRDATARELGSRRPVAAAAAASTEEIDTSKEVSMPPTRQQQNVVNDDYDPYSSATYPQSHRHSRLIQEEEDPNAIGLARSSDLAIPAPRTPSPQSPALSSQRGIQGQMERYDPAPQGAPPRNANGLAAPPPFVRTPSGEQRPQSAHFGDSALAGHRNVNAFASAPVVAPPRVGSSSSSRQSTPRGRQEQAPPPPQQQQRQPQDFPPRTSSAHSRERAVITTTITAGLAVAAAAAAAAEARSKTSSPLQANAAGRQSPRAAAAAANNVDGANGDASGLVPRPVDPRRASSEDKKRDFEDLLKSGDNETVKYTLTPVRVTNETSPGVATTLKASPVPSDRASGSKTLSSQTPSLLRSQAAGNSVGAAAVAASSDSNPNITADNNTASTPASQKKRLQYVAREPRIRQESMRDFADFIRTTGPDKEMNVIPIIPRTGSRQTSGSAGASTIDAKRKSAMTARDPAVRRDGNRDLIDFLRQGPPGENGAAPQPARGTAAPNPQLVAPFNRPGEGSSGVSSAPAPTGRMAPPVAPPGQAQQTGGPSGPEPSVKKTRRRVKDPYAIDLDDEDDDDDDLLTALPGTSSGGRPQRQEESLIEFLRSTPPPSTNAPQRLAVGAGSTPTAVNGAGVNGTTSSGGTPDQQRRRGSAPLSNGVGGSSSSSPRMQTRPAGASRDARAARAEATQSTNELSEFLRNSGPPGGATASPAAAPSSPAGSGAGKAKGGKFWRKRATIDA